MIMRVKGSASVGAVFLFVVGFLLVTSGGFATEPPAKLQKKNGPAVTMGDSTGGVALDAMSTLITTPFVEVRYNKVSTGVHVGNPVVYEKLSPIKTFKWVRDIFYHPQQAGGQQVLHVYSFADLKAQGIKVSTIAGTSKNWAIGWKYNEFYSVKGVRFMKKPLEGDTVDQWILSPLITNQKIYPNFLNTLNSKEKEALAIWYYWAAYSKADPGNALKNVKPFPEPFGRAYVAVDIKLPGDIKPPARLVGSRMVYRVSASLVGLMPPGSGRSPARIARASESRKGAVWGIA